MGNDWITVGGAIVLCPLIIAVSEVRYDKYDEVWIFDITLKSDSRYNTDIHIQGKDEETVKHDHKILTNAVIARAGQ